MLDTLLFVLVVAPFIAALGLYFLRANAIRVLIVLVAGALLAGASLALFSHAPFAVAPGLLGMDFSPLITILDFVLLFVFLGIGLRTRHTLITIFAIVQLLLLTVLELFLVDHGHQAPLFVGDSLSMLMVAVVSIVGSVIVIHALPYMKNHEEHQHLHESRQPQFFAVLLLFLGAMNGLVLTNSFAHFYFFFEVTTLCSFLLIRHDLTDIAKSNAIRALWMNSLGGVALLAAIVWIYLGLGTLDMQEVIREAPQTAFFLVPFGLLCLAGFTKAAQLPFQSWLLGAMVAPTPTSALLHSSTMVKAGVYLILRFSPAFMGTFFSDAVAIAGAFTFLAAGALAIGQSNGKKILAYSTVSNLGLIIACAGVNTPDAMAAAMFLILFHAISKALMFLCVGTIEQRIESRDIEDMRGLYAKMPLTAIFAVLGSLTMILPPFGVLLGKWMAIEAAANSMLIVIMLAVGSALTVLYWARWAGIFMSYPLGDKIEIEKQPLLTRAPLLGLVCGAFILSFFAPWIYSDLILPSINQLTSVFPMATYATPFETTGGILSNAKGIFPVVPLFVIAVGGGLLAIMSFKRAGKERTTGPYLSGAQMPDDVNAYRGPLRNAITPSAANYYLESLFGESRLTGWVNGAAIMLILLMIGGGL
ncbi:NADH-quinone oxidoreductase subunit L [Oceanidesulfovibrio indonesiensis]|uniref:NADH-quinone oxidoreductase subunit L n=1 Tax=Oceanidesulfovibrio indonesiensis TaxID=54767 RepID=A0A7M3MJT3_9BACT|nr:proton-conducting transporter membrane subunit [Oceanidesulfovibrio indonesiensis]TVM19828.1 NADH-quinone oxidoreductase subunit L [Oceanidesulfovibrio indonesiensis]